ncbi:MAG TPA: hypothetical protein VFJ95_14325 [Gammaproteobacteria bacterium]|nr:hypothetical protein [Gammaproteobacteria bacterium]
MSVSSEALQRRPPLAARGAESRRRERLFFSGMSIALAIMVFAGFAPTFYLHGPLHSTFVLSSALKWHGAAFTTWMLLLVAQTSLVAANRTDLHRRLGVAGAVLAVIMIVLGAYVAVSRTAAGLTTTPPGMSPYALLAVPLMTIVVFPVLVGAALWYRKRTDFHKRLMIIATLELVTAAVARLPGMQAAGPPAFFGGVDLFLVAIVIYDLATLKRVHPATLWGGLVLVLSQPLRLVIGLSAPWFAFAAWLTT